MSDLVEKLRAVRAKLESGWCQEAFALDKHGREVNSTSDAAVSWCMIGACAAAAKSPAVSDSTYELVRVLKVASGKMLLGQFNDAPGRTKAEVLAVVDKAIANAEAGNG